MILLADNGGSSCTWCWYAEDNGLDAQELKTIGAHPSKSDFDQLITAYKEANGPIDDISEVHFYSTGTGAQSNKLKILDHLAKCFVNAEIHLQSDILAVGRSAFLNGDGICGILGTGANAGYYSGGVLSCQPVSLGYLLGDEGSGAWLGKQFLTAYTRNNISDSLKKKFDSEFGRVDREFLHGLYHNDYPSDMLGNIGGFVIRNQQEEDLNALLKKGLDLFVSNYIKPIYTKYPNASVSVIGGVALNTGDLLEQAMEHQGIKEFSMQHDIMDGLKQFHTKGL